MIHALYKTVPKALQGLKLYELLAIVDAIRDGRPVKGRSPSRNSRNGW
jgi:hypothetical protein